MAQARHPRGTHGTSRAWLTAFVALATCAALLAAPATASTAFSPAPIRAPRHAADAGPASLDAAPPATATCGNASQPDCPLQAWMKENALRPIATNDMPALARALAAMARFAPPGAAYADWASIANDGANAARAGEMNAAKAACRGCHTRYLELYKRDMRTRPL